MLPLNLFVNSSEITERIKKLSMDEDEQELFMEMLVHGAFNLSKKGHIKEGINYTALKGIDCADVETVIFGARELAKKLEGMSVEFILNVIEETGEFSFENAANVDVEGLFFYNRFYPKYCNLNDIFCLCSEIGENGNPMDEVVKGIIKHYEPYHGDPAEVIKNISNDTRFISALGHEDKIPVGLGYFTFEISDDAREKIKDFLNAVSQYPEDAEIDRLAFKTVEEDMLLNYNITNGITLKLTDLGKEAYRWYRKKIEDAMTEEQKEFNKRMLKELLEDSVSDLSKLGAPKRTEE